MSRVGRKPIEIPGGVNVEINGHHIVVSGSLGKLERDFHRSMNVKLINNRIEVTRASDSKEHRSLHGLTRTLLSNMVQGVVKGFSKQFEISGVGYRANVEGKKLTLTIGFTHPVEIILPDGIQAKVEKQTIVTLSGVDKEVIGELAAKIRSMKKPEPYKGRGIKYVGEYVRRKVGKAATTAGKGNV